MKRQTYDATFVLGSLYFFDFLRWRAAAYHGLPQPRRP